MAIPRRGLRRHGLPGALLLAALLPWSPPAGANPVFPGLSLDAGESLSIHFVLDPGASLPPSFNVLDLVVGVASASVPGARYELALLEEDGTLVSTSGVQQVGFATPIAGFGETWGDPGLGPLLPGFPFALADLSSVLDGTGLLRFRWLEGPALQVTEIRLGFGATDPAESQLELLPATFTLSVAAVPEPGTLLLRMAATGALGVGRLPRAAPDAAHAAGSSSRVASRSRRR